MLNENYIVAFPHRWSHYEREGWNLLFDPVNMVWIRLNRDGMKILEVLKAEKTIRKTSALLALELPGENPEDIQDGTKSFINSLVKVGFLHLNKYWEKKWELKCLSVPNNIYMIMTYRCNLNCRYCSNRPDRRQLNEKKDLNNEPELSLNAYRQLVDDAKTLGVKKFLFTGGEPLLNPNTLQLGKYVKEAGMETELITNGLLIEEVNAAEIVATFNYITVSLDSMNKDSHEKMRGTGTFEKVVNGIMLLKKSGGKVRVNSVISGINVGEIVETRKYVLNNLKCDLYTPSLYSPTGSSRKEYETFLPGIDELVEELEKMRKYHKVLPGIATTSSKFRFSCGLVNGEIGITYNGHVYPCHLLLKPELKCGDLRKQRLDKILEESPLMAKLRAFNVNDIEDCRGCDFKYFCGGGCLAMNYNLYGDFYKTSNLYCKYLKREHIERMWSSTVLESSESMNKKTQTKKVGNRHR